MAPAVFLTLTLALAQSAPAEAADPAQIERIRKALTETQAITVARRSVRTWDVCRRADLSTGVQSLFLSGLKTAIGVLGIMDGRDERYLVLQNSSGPAPFFAGPGLVLQFGSPGGASTVLATALARPTAMLRDAKNGTVYVTELLTGRIVALALGS